MPHKKAKIITRQTDKYKGYRKTAQTNKKVSRLSKPLVYKQTLFHYRIPNGLRLRLTLEIIAGERKNEAHGATNKIQENR